MFVRFLILGWAGQLSIRSATFLLWTWKDKSSFLTHSSNKTSVIQLFLRFVSSGKLLYIFKAPWLFGLANHKHFQFFLCCTSGRHAYQSYFTVLSSRTIFSKKPLHCRALIINKKVNLCLHCHSMFQRQLKMALKIGNLFVNEDDLILVIVKASTDIDTYVNGYHVYKNIWKKKWSLIMWWINMLFILKRTLL